MRVQVLLSVQRGLLGEVTPDLRAVAVAWSTGCVIGRFYYERAITDDMVECVNEIETSVMADFPDVEVRFAAVSAPEGTEMDALEAWAYVRAE